MRPTNKYSFIGQSSLRTAGSPSEMYNPYRQLGLLDPIKKAGETFLNSKLLAQRLTENLQEQSYKQQAEYYDQFVFDQNKKRSARENKKPSPGRKKKSKKKKGSLPTSSVGVPAAAGMPSSAPPEDPNVDLYREYALIRRAELNGTAARNAMASFLMRNSKVLTKEILEHFQVQFDLDQKAAPDDEVIEIDDTDEE